LCGPCCRTRRLFHWASFERGSAEATKSNMARAASKTGPGLWYESVLDDWRGFFGDYRGGEVVERAREREWRSALRGARTLLRFYPPWQRRGRPPVAGRVRFGSLRRLTPVSRNFGWERGGPIDRYYIEDFLARHAGRIRGRVLEIQDASYTQRFGGERVSTSDVLDVTEDNQQATIHADLTRADHVPSDTFDCIILTQTLHVIYDVHSVTQPLYRILKPGGVLLATFPGISQVDWTDHWYWSLSGRAAWRLFEEAFPAGNVAVETHGNALVATAFLHGLGAAELRREELDFRDPDCEFLIAIKAEKPGGNDGWRPPPQENQDG
jgi:SAM-dependent methyltransferase